jgi:hypothetical protein
MFAGAVPRGELLFAVEVASLTGKRRMLAGSALRCVLGTAGAPACMHACATCPLQAFSNERRWPGGCIAA